MGKFEIAAVPLLAGFFDWWGLSLPQTLIVLALILVIVDVFVQSDVATHVAYILVAFTAAYLVPVHILFRIIIGLLAWGGLVWFHYALWRSAATHIVNALIAPTKYQTGAPGLVGAKGTIKEVQGKKMVSVQGDLWDFESQQDVPTGSDVKILSEEGGVLRVEFLKEDN